jgi:rhodanese-related sulfurtransferase/glyoxylase-like metal-dependent hydrolase (beta-lactamase superfamily II)
MTMKKIVTVTEALDRMRAGALMIDVRDADEYAEAHVVGTTLIPLPELEARLAEFPRDRELLLFCRSSRRSGLAQDALIDRFGYANVANVEGGILAWEKAGLPIAKMEAPKPMFFKQFYLGCLAHASYLIGADGVGAVIDPQRDVDTYVEAAKEAGLEIRYIFETHVHADFVSGHRELAARTGAQIVFGHRAGATFDHIAARDGDRIDVGSLRFDIMETPGHTPEGICILVTDTANAAEPVRLLTGDTLFIGDVGRPDLIGSKGFSAADMAGMLYDSLHEKILKLDDAVEVFPAHGAGSLCGRSMSTERSSTIGVQRATNHALQPMTKAAFIELMTTGLPEQPAYFALDAEMNRNGVEALGDLRKPQALDAAGVKAAMASGALVLDVRPSEVYGPEHVPMSMNIGLDGQFAAWAGALIPFARRIVVVALDDASVNETVTRLARIGLATVDGYLEGGFAAWKAAGFATASIPQISVDELAARVERGLDAQLIDVRRSAEHETGIVRGAIPIPLPTLEASLEKIDPERPIVLVCGSGYRSSAAGSILESCGFTNITNVDGGMNEYNAHHHPTVVLASA